MPVPVRDMKLLKTDRVPVRWALLAASLLVGCTFAFESEDNPVYLPSPTSPGVVARGGGLQTPPIPARPAPPREGVRVCPRTADGQLCAGFGRADITPPPGLGLFGYGSEGRRATGYRLRLYARALILEDKKNGERVAFVVADLAVVSTILHRLVAQEVVAATGIGADRLFLAGTHTHSAPGHFLDAEPQNLAGSEVSGYDPAVVNFLVERIANAVREAHDNLLPARIGWGTKDAPFGRTRNRSIQPYNQNPSFIPPRPRPASPPGAREMQAVDPTWTMLRVDTKPKGAKHYSKAGALSILAIHGTGNPPPTDVYDGDIPALVERALEVHIDGAHLFRQQSEHLFANGPLGDVSPSLLYDEQGNLIPEGGGFAPREVSSCPFPAMLRLRRPGGPRTPPGWEEWRAPSARAVAKCIAAGRAFVDEVALGRGGTVSAPLRTTRDTSLGRRAIELYEGISPEEATVTISRAFETLPLTSGGAAYRICPPGKIGTAATAGARDGRSRFLRWKLFGFIPIGIDDGRSAIAHLAGCQQPKRVLFYPVQGPAMGRHAFPGEAQLAVVRITAVNTKGKEHTMLIGMVPVEPTTLAGRQMMDAMRDGAATANIKAQTVALMAITNGYTDYVTTREEYSRQAYEGGSNLFAGEMATLLSTRLRALTESLAKSGQPIVDVGPVAGYPGDRRTVFPAPNGPQPSNAGPIVATSNKSNKKATIDTLVVTWTDMDPGALIPADGQMVRILHNGKLVAWDDSKDVVVRAIKDLDVGYKWEVRWALPFLSRATTGDVTEIFIERWFLRGILPNKGVINW